MSRRLLLFGSLACMLVRGGLTSPLHAQTASDRQKATIGSIKQAILADTGYPAAAVEVTATASQYVVTVVNSKLTSASGKEREAEATRIVAAIARTITGNADSRTILTIHVDYVSREQGGSGSHTVDTIDFRRNPQGAFEHHIT